MTNSKLIEIAENNDIFSAVNIYSTKLTKTKLLKAKSEGRLVVNSSTLRIVSNDPREQFSISINN